MGRPGSGKDTQAQLLAEKFNLQPVDTAHLLQEKFKSDSSDSQVASEKEMFETGELNTPQWVLGIVREHVTKLVAQDFDGKKGVIFSGSPRTQFEAEGLVPFLEGLFGAENLFAVYLDITEEEGIRRILKRNARALDRDPEKLKIRMQEYDTRTKPVLDFLKKRGMLSAVDGMKAREGVLEDAVAALNAKGAH
jgi:adenylate kinase